MPFGTPQNRGKLLAARLQSGQQAVGFAERKNRGDTYNDDQRLGTGYSSQLIPPDQPIAFVPEIFVVEGFFFSFEGFAEAFFWLKGRPLWENGNVGLRDVNHTSRMSQIVSHIPHSNLKCPSQVPALYEGSKAIPDSRFYYGHILCA